MVFTNTKSELTFPLFSLLTHCMLGKFSCCLFSSKKLTSKQSFRNTIRTSNSWDPDQTRRFVGPDLGPYCLSRLLADDTGRQRVNTIRIDDLFYVISILTTYSPLLLRITYPCNAYPLTSHFYIVKLAFMGVYTVFLFLL